MAILTNIEQMLNYLSHAILACDNEIIVQQAKKEAYYEMKARLENLKK